MTASSDRHAHPARTEADLAADLLLEEDSAVTERRVQTELQGALARHLLGGRASADLAHILLATLTVFVFWGATGPWAGLLWLTAFVLTAAARAVNRRRASAGLNTPRGIIGLVRRDVWIAAFLWGGWAMIHAGAAPKELAYLLLIFAGLVAAATSTLVADGPSFFGFMLLLLGPLTGAVLIGEMDRDHVSMLLLILLFVPFMVTVHRRAHAILVEQVRSGARLKIAEAQTARRRDFLNALLTSAPTPIVVLDASGDIVRVNPAFESTLGYDGEGVRGEHFVDLITDPREQAPLLTFLDMVREGQRTTADLPVRRVDGAARWMRLSGTLARGTTEGTLILVGEDVTEQVEAREAQMTARVQAEEAARAKSSFLASMSHEIRTPMNGILGMVEILLDSPLAPDQRQTAEVIRASGRGLLRILNDILDVSKIEAGQLDLEEVDFALHELVADVARIFTVAASQRGNELLVDIGPGVPSSVRGDPHRIRQILSNLVGNAVKFTEGGEVVLGLRTVGGGSQSVEVRFGVRDTGVGIPLDKQEQIFREFEQADSSTTRTHGGTGLGLSISQRLVELMGGRIELDSAPGQGSDFHFVLQLALGSDELAGTGAGRGVDLRTRRFLVVDDNTTARRIVREALNQAGAQVLEGEGVDQGLSLLFEAFDAGSPLDAVILDHMMPERDGFDFARAVRGDRRFDSVPMLMLTSAGPAGGSERARAEGIAGYMSKPVSRSELLHALGAILERGGDVEPVRALVTRQSIGHGGPGARILLAEDNPVNQQVAVALLSKRGHEVVAVPDGAQAVELAEGGGFDLVLMDIQMPVMDGLEATRRIREQPGNAELPIVALTAHAFAEERERCRVAGMNDFLAKPFKPDDLFDLVERWASGRAQPDPNAKGEEEGMTSGSEECRAPVDLEGFREVMRAAGVEEVVDTTIEIYLAEAPTIFSALDTAVLTGASEDVRRAAHSLKSASGNIRAERLASLLQEMEHRGRDQDVEGAREALEELRAEYRAVIAYLQRVPGD